MSSSLSVSLFIYWSVFICLYVHILMLISIQSICITVNTSVCLSICLPISLLSVCIFLSISLCLDWNQAVIGKGLLLDY